MKINHKKVSSPKGEINIYEIVNEKGASVVLSSLGAGIVAVNVPDAAGKIENVALGYAEPADYFYDGPCAGKTPGRYANRIARGRFSIDGHEYTLAVNNGPNALHGGPEGFQNRLWESRTEGYDTVVFTRVSPDGEEGYPGNLDVEVRYTWSEDNRLVIDYRAVTDKATVVNLTNHTYWNLRGESAGNALDHHLKLYCSRYLPTDDTLVPTGEMDAVAGTPMDFTTAHAVGDNIKADFPALVYGKGYDNCWLIDGHEAGKLSSAASLYSPASGRRLDVYTTQPAAQVYTGNWLEGCPKSISGGEYHDYDGIAIECQACPDAPNKPAFPSTILRPGEVYSQKIVYAFSINK